MYNFQGSYKLLDMKYTLPTFRSSEQTMRWIDVILHELLHFVHPTLKLVPLLTVMWERSVQYFSSTFSKQKNSFVRLKVVK